MRRLAIVAVALVAVLAGLLILVRGNGISAVNARPWPFEARGAKAAWRFLVPPSARDAPNPVDLTPAVLKSAREHFADHCASCHDNDGSGATTVGRRVYPRAPDMREASTQRLTDGELFYAIEQGIPFTAMPGWATGTEHGEQQSWALMHFIRHLPSITPDELKEMERLNPKAPPNDERDREIDDFLRGPAETQRDLKGRSD